MIQFSITHLFVFSLNVKEFYLTLSGATTLCQRGPGIDGNDGVLCISQSSSIRGAPLTDCLMSYPGYSLQESYLCARIQSVYSAPPAECAIINRDSYNIYLKLV